MGLPLVMRQTSHLSSICCHTLCSISAVTSAIIRVRNSMTFAGKAGTNTRSLTSPHKKKSRGTTPLYQSADLGNVCWSTRALLQGIEGVCGLVRSECVLLGHLRLTVEWRTGNGRLHEEGAVHSLFAGAQNKFTFGLPRTWSRETRRFSKLALITENYEDQISLIVLYPMKHLTKITIPGKTRCSLLH
jgi:hypothetical protein